MPHPMFWFCLHGSGRLCTIVHGPHIDTFAHLLSFDSFAAIYRFPHTSSSGTAMLSAHNLSSAILTNFSSTKSFASCLLHDQNPTLKSNLKHPIKAPLPSIRLARSKRWAKGHCKTKATRHQCGRCKPRCFGTKSTQKILSKQPRRYCKSNLS